MCLSVEVLKQDGTLKARIVEAKILGFYFMKLYWVDQNDIVLILIFGEDGSGIFPRG